MNKTPTPEQETTAAACAEAWEVWNRHMDHYQQALVDARRHKIVAVQACLDAGWTHRRLAAHMNVDYTSLRDFIRRHQLKATATPEQYAAQRRKGMRQ